MTIEAAKPEQVLEIADSFGFELSADDAISFAGLMNGIKASYDRLDELIEPTLPVKYDRSPGYRPSADENPHNAWYYKTEIKGAPTGKLAGKTVALKDNVMVAGVPMMNGSATLEGFVPNVDATVATRLLDAGAPSDLPQRSRLVAPLGEERLGRVENALGGASALGLFFGARHWGCQNIII